MITKLFTERIYKILKSTSYFDKDKDFTILINPTRSEIQKETLNWGDHLGLRGLLSLDGKNLYVWDSFHSTHYEVIPYTGNRDNICIYFSLLENKIFLTSSGTPIDGKELEYAEIVKNSKPIIELFGKNVEIFYNGQMLEFNRKDILKGKDNKFIHHGKYTDDLKSKLGSVSLFSDNWFLSQVKGGTLLFKIRSATNPSILYDNVVLLKDYAYISNVFKFGDYNVNNIQGQRQLVVDLKQLFRNIIDNGDILTFCSDPSAKYW